MNSDDVTLDMSGLQALKKTLAQGEGLYLKVGILGDYAGRTPDGTGVKRKDSGLTNPQLGLWHEFGLIKKNLPERSFLRMPLLLKLPEAIKNVDWAPFLLGGGLFGALSEIGNMSLGIISQAFATGGFGHWQAWSYSYAKLRERLARTVGFTKSGKRRYKPKIGPVKPGLILVLSEQLQDSVTYAVVRQGAPTTQIMEIEDAI